MVAVTTYSQGVAQVVLSHWVGWAEARLAPPHGHLR